MLSYSLLVADVVFNVLKYLTLNSDLHIYFCNHT